MPKIGTGSTGRSPAHGQSVGLRDRMGAAQGQAAGQIKNLGAGGVGAATRSAQGQVKAQRAARPTTSMPPVGGTMGTAVSNAAGRAKAATTKMGGGSGGVVKPAMPRPGGGVGRTPPPRPGGGVIKPPRGGGSRTPPPRPGGGGGGGPGKRRGGPTTSMPPVTPGGGRGGGKLKSAMGAAQGQVKAAKTKMGGGSTGGGKIGGGSGGY